WLLILPTLAFGAAGCSRPEAVSYSLRKESLELPATQRTEVADFLERYYGSYRFPRLRTSAPTETSAAEPNLELKDQVDPARLAHGREVYAQQCNGCHGVTGAGDGPAAEYLDPPPR